MCKYLNRSNKSKFTVQIKLLVAIQLLFGIGSGYYAENAIISREKTELFWSVRSEKTLYKLQLFGKNVNQSIVSSTNNISWNTVLKIYEGKIVETLKQQKLLYLSQIPLLQAIFNTIKYSTHIDFHSFLTLVG
jgi:hypothetical protein